jgi:hypothetical protein
MINGREGGNDIEFDSERWWCLLSRTNGLTWIKIEKPQKEKKYQPKQENIERFKKELENKKAR